ncbi:serine/threonine-protein kinase [Streptomyces formicae]|uniref:Putative serine/threonine protein kinase n=1 Tax=Streptomyces formicae TaxID=1616117 RepID=A0A291QIL0_9ACTN|nr:serine/threonine-protein kinase [Streptomyces formicae]ATL31551.1 putative serine/threonine protein kinase [Streptomyces formicae]
MAATPVTYGRWTAGTLLGRGTTGTVRLAHDATGHAVALKVVHTFLARDEEFRARFAREVATLGAVHGRHTAALVDADAGVEATVPWVAMEYVRGPTLHARVGGADAVGGGDPLPLGELRSLAGALAWALDTVHGAGLVHGGLKPSNVLLAEAGPRVVDFGMARAMDDASSDTERSARGLPYAAPEQLAQALSTPAADVFSLGAVLAFAATGHAPFAGGPRAVPGDPDLAGAPEPVLPLLAACLAVDPAARPTPRTVARMAGHPLPGSRRKALTVATVLLAFASHHVNSAPRHRTLVDDGTERRAGADGTPG